MKKTQMNQWSTATTDMSHALIDLMNCIYSGYNAWISIEKNGEQEYPVKCVNPELDDPFNWTSNYSKAGHIQNNYINDTQRDLTENWIEVISTVEAANAYKSERKLLPGLISLGDINANNVGKTIRIPVRKEDANQYRATISKDNYTYEIWRYVWEAKKDIPYYIVDDTIDMVYVVRYSSESFTETEIVNSLRSTAAVINHYASQIESKKKQKSLWEFLLSGGSKYGYDVYDVEQDVSITAVPVEEREVLTAERCMDEETYPLLFEMELFKRVKVTKAEAGNPFTIEANWSDLIRKNHSIFQSIEKAYGNAETYNECEEEIFIATWLHRLKGFISGTIPMDMYKELYEFVLKMVPVLEEDKNE